MTGHALLRETIRLARDGYGYADISLKLNIPPDAAKKIVWAVHEQMRLERQRKAS